MDLFSNAKAYRPDEVADIAKISTKTVRRLIRDLDNPLPCFRVKKGGHLRCPGNELNEYFEKNRVKPLEE